MGMRRIIALFAAVALVVLGLGAAAYADNGKDKERGGPPEDNGVTCKKLGYPDNTSAYTGTGGKVTYVGATVTYVVEAGYDLKICVKGGSEDAIHEFVATDSGTYTHPQDVSHIGVIAVKEDTTPDETVLCPEGSDKAGDEVPEGESADEYCNEEDDTPVPPKEDDDNAPAPSGGDDDTDAGPAGPVNDRDPAPAVAGVEGQVEQPAVEVPTAVAAGATGERTQLVLPLAALMMLVGLGFATYAGIRRLGSDR